MYMNTQYIRTCYLRIVKVLLYDENQVCVLLDYVKGLIFETVHLITFDIYRNFDVKLDNRL
jgi:hypothetical protein